MKNAAHLALAERSLILATGPQRVKFLHGLLSNDVANVAPGHGRRAALMDVKGKLLAFLRVLVEDAQVVLEVPTDRAERLEALFNHYKVAAPVRFARPATRVLALLGAGAGAEDALREAGLVVPEPGAERHARATLGEHAVRVARAGDLPLGSFVLHVEPAGESALTAALSAAGAVPLSREGFDVARVEAGRPWYGVDVTEDNLLHETGLLNELHSAAKGCYVGQEVVARLEGRGGHVNKALRGLKLSAPAPAGSAITVAGTEVGRVTTAAVSPQLGPIALGYVHRNHFSPGTRLEVEGAPAEVVGLPFDVAS
jgi:folate-binding protein YgfZ